jgi:hypothetical protein
LLFAALALAAREQIGAGLFPAPVFSQGLQQRRAERNVTAGAAFSAFHADHHALAIDVAELQQRHFGAPHPGAIEGHQQSALQKIPGGIDEARDLLQTQHGGESSVILGIGQIFSNFVSFESSDEEEAQCRDTGNHRADGELPLSEQVGLVASKLIRSELIRRLAKMPGKVRYRLQVIAGRTLRVIPTLKFLQHHLA